MPFFTLQEGERIIREIKPLPNLRKYFFFRWIILVIVFMGIITFPLLDLGPFGILLLLSFIALIGLLLGWYISGLQYKHQHYWITNKRIIYKKGLFGYTVSSIPLERISDIILSRSLLERILGFGSLLIQTLAGQVTQKGYLGAEASLLAIPNPEETQRLIFDFIKQKRKEERISF